MRQEIANLEGLLCSECANKLSKVFGMPKSEIQNGGMKEIVWKVQLAEITMKEAGVQFDQKILIGEAMASVNEVWEQKWVEEIGRQHENELKGLESKYKEDILKSKQAEKELSDSKLINEKLSRELDEYKSKERFQPVTKGDKLEDIVAGGLKRAFPTDDVVLETKSKNEVDIKEIVKDGKKVLSKILVECKNTQRWSNRWLDTIREHGQRENTEYLVIVTNTMPNEKFISPLGLEKEGVLITTPEKSIWAVAFMRQAIVKTADKISKLENERERLSKMAQVKQRLLELVSKKDFENILEACEDIQLEAQEVRNEMNKFASTINSSTGSIDKLVGRIITTNSHLSEAFGKLAE